MLMLVTYFEDFKHTLVHFVLCITARPVPRMHLEHTTSPTTIFQCLQQQEGGREGDKQTDREIQRQRQADRQTETERRDKEKQSETEKKLDRQTKSYCV